MATSLAAQLKKLAVPETQNLFSGDFKQASFLYDDQEAATYTKQHFYNIGVNGLQQLIAKDVRFAEFEQNLFSQSSQSMQRYVQTAEVNQQLDITINKFLLRLSSYMQLREAHKAMEWMVHRYNVHLRNIDTFMMCLLPYHDQQPFIMALQLMRMNSNEAVKWRWLEPVKKGGTFLPRQTLITHCRSTTGFLGFMCDMLSKHIEANTDEETGIPSARHLQRVISFFTQTTLGVLVSGTATESIVSTLLPVITSGLKSHGLPDQIVSSYMILSQLFLQTNLADKVLQSLLNVIAKNMLPNLVHSSVMVIVIMFQKQDISSVTKKAFRYLVRQPSLIAYLREMSKDSNTDPFLGPFLTSLVKRALREAKSGTGKGFSTAGESSNAEDDEDTPASAPSLMSLLMEMLETINLSRPIVMDVTRMVLAWFSEEENETMDVDDSWLHEGPFRVFKLLENKYSLVLEEVIQEMGADPKRGKKVKQAARHLFKMSVESAHKNLISDPVTSVTICLHHRQGIVRQRAVEKLLEDPKLIEDKSCVQSSLALKLQDDSPDVVKALLKEPTNLWAMFEDTNLLYTSLLNCVTNSGFRHKGEEVQRLMLEALCCLPSGVGDETQMSAIVLAFLVVRSREDVHLASSLLESKFALSNKLLTYIAKSWLPSLKKLKEKDNIRSEISHLYSKLVDAVKTFLLKNFDQVKKQVLESLFQYLSSTSRPGCLGFLILSISGAVIRETKEAALKIGLKQMMASFLSELTLNQVEISIIEDLGPDEVTACLVHLQRFGTLPMSQIKKGLQDTDVGLVTDSLKDLQYWSLSGDSHVTDLERDWLKTATTVVNVLLELREKASKDCSKIAEECFASFFKVFSDKESVMKFLCMIWMSESTDGVLSVHKARLLQFAQVYLTSLIDKERQALLSKSLPFLPCMLILLSSEFETVRKIAFDLLTLAAESGSALNQDESTSIWFTRNLLRFREEVIKDSAFLSQVVKTLLEGDDLGAYPPSPKKRRRSSSKQPVNNSALLWLLENVTNPKTPGNVKAGLLRILQKMDTSESFLPLVPMLKSMLKSVAVQKESSAEDDREGKTQQTLSREEKEIVQLLLKRITPAVAPAIDEMTDALETLLLALLCPASLGAQGFGNTVQMLMIKQLQGKFMFALPLPARKMIVAELLKLTAVSSSTEVVRHCRKVIKHMSLESSIVIDELKSVLVKPTVSTVREAKRQKLLTSGQSGDSELETLPWKRITVLLEMLQSKKKVKAAVSMVPVTFQVLGRVLEVENDGSGEYLKQLLLGLINFVCSRHWEEGEQNNTVNGEHLNMDLIVQCIRSSDNAHTHHQALLLLSSAAKIAPTSGPLSTSDMDFLSGLSERFSSSQLLVAFQETLSYILALPEEKAAGAPLQIPKSSSKLEDMSAEDMAIFSVASHTPKHLRHFKFASVYALNQLMAGPYVVAQLSETDPSTYLASYQKLLETCLQWISKVTESLQHHMEDTSRRYWKLLLHKSHDLLDTLVNLLPDSMFFEVVSGLMSHNLTLVQRRAMELLNAKLLQQRETAVAEQSMLLSMVGKLHTIASSCLIKSKKESVGEENLVNGQTALYSLKILCRMLGQAHHKHFTEVLLLCVKALADHSDNGSVSSSAMLCIAEIVSAAKTHILEHLSVFMPLFVAQLQSDTITQHDVLLLATITSLHKVIEVLPLFLSPYLQDIFTQVCIINSLIGTDSDVRKPMVSQKLKLISGTLATATPTRTFLPVVEKSFVAMEDKMASCAECAMSMLKEHIVTMSREDMTTFSQDLLKFFFVCFEIRISHTEVHEQELDQVEGCVIEAFVTLVFKLSEAQFKPMLLQIYNWASEEDVSHERVLFFYRLCNSLAEKLKSLFTLFAGHILKHSAQMLDENNKSKSKCRFFGKGKSARTKSSNLVQYVAGCLQKTFAHDTEGFMNKERFDIVMQPLVDQLENELGNPSTSEDRALNYIVPCITSLAAAARDDSLWKDLNYQILLKTRHQNPKVRMWALAAVDAFHKELGEDYTQLVPEAIPFMAELMEDESDEVEKYTQKVLAAMEVSVGENLQEYF
ncbi:hypothetical protein EGW08_012842 [Elysia chlorotica]|uniref:HEAT repeat-containing protein 1 n=1 Tax=Elysia chlorotica TaxID=188477 RepID=A0A3S1BA73_ELYCH|nr:hypothetical protein EGW08_012842 [Elysia chlorotica]